MVSLVQLFFDGKVIKDLLDSCSGLNLNLELSSITSFDRYGYKVAVMESHYLPGGVAHSFKRKGFSFDAGTDIPFVKKLLRSSKSLNLDVSCRPEPVEWHEYQALQSSARGAGDSGPR